MNSPEQLESISPASSEVEPKEGAVQEIMETRREAFLETFKGYSERKIVDAAYVGGVIKDKTQQYLVEPTIRSMKKKMEMVETASMTDRMRYAAAMTASLAGCYLAAKKMPAEVFKAESLKYFFVLPEVAAWLDKIGPKAAQAIQAFCGEKKDLFLQAMKDATVSFQEK